MKPTIVFLDILSPFRCFISAGTVWRIGETLMAKKYRKEYRPVGAPILLPAVLYVLLSGGETGHEREMVGWLIGRWQRGCAVNHGKREGLNANRSAVTDEVDELGLPAGVAGVNSRASVMRAVEPGGGEKFDN